MRPTRAACVLLLALVPYTVAVRIDSVSPRTGGLEGGQLVTITGQDFGVETKDVFTEHVEVYFGGANNPNCDTCEQPVTQCIPEHFLSSSTNLVCRTAKPDPRISLEDMDDLLVTVNISGVSTTCSASSCLYTFRDDHTPVIHSVQPSIATAGSIVTIEGRTCERDLHQFEQIFVGPYVCSVVDPDGNFGEATLNGGSSGCATGSIKCWLGRDILPGNYNVSFTLPKWGHSRPSARSLMFDGTTGLADLFVRPAITDITETVSEVFTTVNISMAAITETALSHVTYDGVACTDMAFASDGAIGSVTCKVPTVLPKSLYLGGGGAVVRAWRATEVSTLRELAVQVAADANGQPGAIPPYVTRHLDSLLAQDGILDESHAAYTRAAFVPPTTGTYTFRLATSGPSQLYLTEEKTFAKRVATMEASSQFVYVGCLRNNRGDNIGLGQRYNLGAKRSYDNRMTLEMCAEDCAGYAFFGMREGRSCQCGDSAGQSDEPADEAMCTTSCPGNPSQTCGGVRKDNLAWYTTYMRVMAKAVTAADPLAEFVAGTSAGAGESAFPGGVKWTTAPLLTRPRLLEAGVQYHLHLFHLAIGSENEKSPIGVGVVQSATEVTHAEAPSVAIAEVQDVVIWSADLPETQTVTLSAAVGVTACAYSAFKENWILPNMLSTGLYSGSAGEANAERHCDSLPTCTGVVRRDFAGSRTWYPANGYGKPPTVSGEASTSFFKRCDEEPDHFTLQGRSYGAHGKSPYLRLPSTTSLEDAKTFCASDPECALLAYHGGDGGHLFKEGDAFPLRDNNRWSAFVKAGVEEESGLVYEGCYVDGHNGLRGMEVSVGERADWDFATPENCAVLCGEGYRYVAVQYGRECWCGNELPSASGQEYSIRPEEECDSRCNGDASRYCGGYYRNTVYSRVQKKDNGLSDMVTVQSAVTHSTADVLAGAWTLSIGGRQSDPIPFNAAAADVKAAAEAVLGATCGALNGATGGDWFDHDSFEADFEADAWRHGEVVSKTDPTTAFCGRQSLKIDASTKIANFWRDGHMEEGQNWRGYSLATHKFMSMAYKIPAGGSTAVNMVIEINRDSRATCSIALFGVDFSSRSDWAHPKCADWGIVWVQDLGQTHMPVNNDGQWHYAEMNLHDQLKGGEPICFPSLGCRSGDWVNEISGVRLESPSGISEDGTVFGTMHMDEFAVTSEPRRLVRDGRDVYKTAEGVAAADVQVEVVHEAYSTQKEYKILLGLTSCGAAFDPFTVTSALTGRDANLVVATTAAASVPWAGQVALALTGYFDAVQLPVGANASEVRGLLEAEIGEGKVAVSTLEPRDLPAQRCNRAGWRLTLRGVAGDVDAMRAEVSGVAGDMAKATVMTRVDGGLARMPLDNGVIATEHKTPQIEVFMKDGDKVVAATCMLAGGDCSLPQPDPFAGIEQTHVCAEAFSPLLNSSATFKLLDNSPAACAALCPASGLVALRKDTCHCVVGASEDPVDFDPVDAEDMCDHVCGEGDTSAAATTLRGGGGGLKGQVLRLAGE